MDISISSQVTCYSFKGSGQVLVYLIDVVIPCYLTISCVSFYTFLFLISYELLALSLMLYPNVDQLNLQTNENN